MLRVLTTATLILAMPLAYAQGDCGDLPSADQLKKFLNAAPTRGGKAGGLFNGERSWAAVVDRAGRLCAATTSTDDPYGVWPGSQAIAKSKAYTANAFSVDPMPLSTARLYTFTQPGHSLWSLGQSNAFDPGATARPDQRQGRGDIAGGLIFFGGGVPLYRDGKVVGGLGVSGDTSCTDHEIAKRVRDQAGMNPPKGADADDITYSAKDKPSAFTHPLCVNTHRNGEYIGEEAAAKGY